MNAATLEEFTKEVETTIAKLNSQTPDTTRQTLEEAHATLTHLMTKCDGQDLCEGQATILCSSILSYRSVMSTI
jgi:hypothetical protein